MRFACIGPRTAAALARRGRKAAVVAERHIAEGLLDALPLDDMRGRRVLLPQGAGARAILAQRLKDAGVQVTEVEAYRAVADARGATGVRERLERGEIDVLTFTSSSTVERFVEAVGTDTRGASIAVIGPVTAQTARDFGLVVDVVAQEQTVPGLIAALVESRTRAESEQP